MNAKWGMMINLSVPRAEQWLTLGGWVSKRQLSFELGLFGGRRVRKPCSIPGKVSLVEPISLGGAPSIRVKSHLELI